jgi:wyosine [tRNA(Phe)-imidazoG37] synthetase (radical SAM superfamily)
VKENDERLGFIFGPVPSRRLGQSLGIDTIPLKTCNWNCVYCQLGRTVPLINKRREYFPREAILIQIEEALSKHGPGEIDWVTFVGSGEPTLHAGLGWLIRHVKELTDLPVAVITNGSLLFLPEVRGELSAADAVMPSLDAGSASMYRQINRPHPETTFDRLVTGLEAFRLEYCGNLWIEVMLVQGVNDSEETLQNIAQALRFIRPDEVHINLPTRPPAETWVAPPCEETLLLAEAILGDIAKVVHPAEGTFDLGDWDTAIDAILGIISRHPMRQAELEMALCRWAPEQIDLVLSELEASGLAQIVERVGSRFWSAAPSYFPDEVRSLAVAPGERADRQPNNERI